MDACISIIILKKKVFTSCGQFLCINNFSSKLQACGFLNTSTNNGEGTPVNNKGICGEHILITLVSQRPRPRLSNRARCWDARGYY